MKTPRDLADRMSGKGKWDDGYKRESFALPLPEAREEATKFFLNYPKEAYMTSVESWQTLPDGRIAFTMKRLRSAD